MIPRISPIWWFQTVFGVAVLLSFCGAAWAAPVPLPRPASIQAQPMHLSIAAAERLDAHDLTVYARALRAARAEQPAVANRIAALAQNPSGREAVAWLAGVEAPHKLTHQEAVAWLRRFHAWPRARDVQRHATATLPQALSSTAVIAWFHDEPPHTLDALIRLLEAMELNGDQNGAQALLRQRWRTLRLDAREERTLLRRYGRWLSPEDHQARLDHLLWNRRYSEAGRLDRHVDPGWRKLARARRLLAQRAAGVDGAVAAVPAALHRDPGLIYERVRWRRLAGMHERAIDLILDDTAALDGNRVMWWDELRTLARWALDEGKADTAHLLVTMHGLDGGGVDYAEAEWLAGWIALVHLNRPAEALDHFQRLHANVTTPVSLARARFWTGRALGALGDHIGAQLWYRKAAVMGTTFYGQRGALALRTVEPWSPREAEPPSPAVLAWAEGHPLAAAYRFMVQMDEPQEGRTLLSALYAQATTDEQRTAAASLPARVGMYPGNAVRMARRARRDGLVLLEQGYPLPNGETDGIPARAAILAIMRQESTFMADARSGAGALGMMQIMPATGRLVARRLGLSFDHTRLTQDPAYNIMLGTAYLENLVRQYDGSLLLAAAAYNAGPGRVARWMRQYGDPRTMPHREDWIEAIPFSETRNYVQRVLEGWNVYRVRMGMPVRHEDLGNYKVTPEAWRALRNEGIERQRG